MSIAQRLLTLADVSELTGFSVDTVRSEIRKGNLATRRLSARGWIRIHPDDYEAWVAAMRKGGQS